MFQEMLRKVAFVISLMFLIIVIASPASGQVYTYTIATADDTYVNGAGYVTGYYNSSTHVYTTSVTVTSPSGRSATASCGGTYCSASLSIGYEDGQYFASSTMAGTCPNVQGGTHPLGGSGSSVTINPWVSINSVTFSSPTVAPGSTVDLMIQASASCGVTGPVGISVTEASHTGSTNYTFTQPNPNSIPCLTYGTEFRSTISNGTTGNNGSKIRMQAYVSACQPSTCEAKNSPKATETELTLQ